MDRFAAWVPGQDDGDLVLLHDQGMAYQKDQSILVPYDESYFNKCAGYEGQEIANRINEGRVDLVSRHFGTGPVLDIGVGSGEFIKRRPLTFGRDINESAVRWLLQNGYWADDLGSFNAYTMWDVIEHVPDPDEYFCEMRPGSYLFTSIPIFKDLNLIRQSKHYRPAEHLYYWTEEGFICWMYLHKFDCIEVSDFETQAGRDSILSFAFRKRK